MAYVGILIGFALLFLWDYKEIKEVNDKRGNIVYGIFFLAAIAYAILFKSGVVTISMTQIVSLIVAYLRGIRLPYYFR